jgi:hypothetical protein
VTPFTVIHLQENRLDETLPLVRMAAPLLSLERWQEFARWVTGNGGGILAAFVGEGRLHGIAAYRTEENLIQGRTLHVEPMVTFELDRSAPARTALCQALELLALARGCNILTIVTGSRGYANPNCLKAGAWAPLGFATASVALSKRVHAMRSASPVIRAR